MPGKKHLEADADGGAVGPSGTGAATVVVARVSLRLPAGQSVEERVGGDKVTGAGGDIEARPPANVRVAVAAVGADVAEVEIAVEAEHTVVHTPVAADVDLAAQPDAAQLLAAVLLAGNGGGARRQEQVVAAADAHRPCVERI